MTRTVRGQLGALRWSCRLRGGFPGAFHLATPIAILGDADARRASADLQAAISDRSWDRADGRIVDVVIDGMSCRLSRFDNDGSNVEFARFAPEDPTVDARVFLERIAKKKRTQLEPWAKSGVPTYLIAYHTAWPLFSPRMRRDLAKSVLAHGEGVIDWVVMVSGNPPGDAWCEGLSATG